jgi:D-amino-acid dehydrogenase
VNPREAILNWEWFYQFTRSGNGRDQARNAQAIHALLQSSRQEYGQFFEREQIDPEWQSRGLLFVFESKHAYDHFTHVEAHIRKHYGVIGDHYQGTALEQLEPSLKPGLAGGFLYRGDGHLRPEVLMAGLRKCLVQNGVAIQEECIVEDFLGREQCEGVVTNHETIAADAVLLTTGAWAPQFAKRLGTTLPILPGKGYSMTFAKNETNVQHPMIFEEHRVAVTPFQSGFRIGSTMEFTGYDESIRTERLGLLTYAAEHYLRTPPQGEAETVWAGLRPMTPDGLPRMGRAPAWQNVWVAAGHGMLGVSAAPGTGRLLAEMIENQPLSIDPRPYALSKF